MAKMLRSDACDSTKYTTLVEQYSKTFKQAGLKTVAEKDSSNDETFCMTLGFISEYTPEEFYQDKELYKDHDYIGDYIERHITRPMINLETGNSIRDAEYFVPDGDEYEDFLGLQDRIYLGLLRDKKNTNKTYLVINTDEPYADEVIEIMKRHGHWGQ
jgi:hypothetical protein